MLRIVALAFGLVAVFTAGARAKTLKVAVSQRGFWDSTMVDIAEKQGFFKEANLDIEVLYLTEPNVRDVFETRATQRAVDVRIRGGAGEVAQRRGGFQ